VVISADKLKGPSSKVVWGGWLLSPEGMCLTAKYLEHPAPPPPKTLADIQRQVAALNYFAPNVPGLALLLQPVHAHLNAAILDAKVSNRKARTLARKPAPLSPEVQDALA